MSKAQSKRDLSTDSIVYKQAESVYLSITEKKRLVYMYLLLIDLCTCIYCYLFYMVLWLTGIPGLKKKKYRKLILPVLDSLTCGDERACALHTQE